MIRTGYSFRKAVGHIVDVINRLKSIDWTVAPIADTCSTFAFVNWTRAAQEAGLRPVYGVELPVAAALGANKPILSSWSFFAIDSLRPLHDLIQTATLNPGREPSLSYADAIAAQGVIKIAGESVLLDYLDPTTNNLYIALSPATPRGLYRAAAKAGFSFVAVSCNRYPTETDYEFYRVTLGKRSSSQTYPQHILSDEELLKHLTSICGEEQALKAIENRKSILGACRATLQKATMLVPAKPKTLRELCCEGAVRLNINLHDPIYKSRLDHELSMIEKKQFEDYFYIISDMMLWARARMVCGPARGSSCGSLVCYLLGITAVDPIPFGLLFERFIDITRKDLPDIDVDFSDIRRHLVFEYIEEKYGSEKVARLGTVGMFKPRSALNQAGIALRIPKWQIEKVLDNIIVRSSGDSRALQQLEDTLKDTEAGRTLLKASPEVLIAGRMEGHPNNASQHAAGIVITEQPVKDIVAVDGRSKSTMCDKYDAEVLNLLKIDALGLTQLSIFERTLQLIGKPDISGFLETLPMDDQKAFDVLNAGHFAGIFQFMGIALKSLTKQIHVDNINDIVAITALARPGPLATGGANAWTRRRSGKEPIGYPHKLLEPYLKDTLGIVIYQEQVMQIGREVGDLDWDDVTALRKAMSKSLGAEYFDRWGDKWKSKAIAKGMPEEIAKDFWSDLCAYGSWSFNKSHAVAYGIVSYWCLWLKAHYPIEFAAATLDAESDPARQLDLLRELDAEGVGYVAIDPDQSTDKWLPGTRGENQQRILIGPITNIKGIGPVTLKKILECRREGKSLPDNIAKKLAAARTDIDTIWPVKDRISQLHPDLSAVKIYTQPTPVKEVQCGISGEVLIIAAAKRIVPRDENETVLIAKRNGREMYGPTKYLNLFFNDDTDEIYCKIDRFKFEQLGAPIIERGRAGKSLYAIKGTVPRGFRMIQVTNVRYLGDMDDQ